MIRACKGEKCEQLNKYRFLRNNRVSQHQLVEPTFPPAQTYAPRFVKQTRSRNRPSIFDAVIRIDSVDKSRDSVKNVCPFRKLINISSKLNPHSHRYIACIILLSDYTHFLYVGWERNPTWFLEQFKVSAVHKRKRKKRVAD